MTKTLRDAKPAGLRRKEAATKMGGLSPSRSSGKVGKRRGTIKNLGTPLGQFAQFLVNATERLGWSADDLHGEMKSKGFTRTHEAVRKWLNGSSAPRLGDLHYVALALGYDDWLAMVTAVAKFHKRTK